MTLQQPQSRNPEKPTFEKADIPAPSAAKPRGKTPNEICRPREGARPTPQAIRIRNGRRWRGRIAGTSIIRANLCPRPP